MEWCVISTAVPHTQAHNSTSLTTTDTCGWHAHTHCADSFTMSHRQAALVEHSRLGGSIFVKLSLQLCNFFLHLTIYFFCNHLVLFPPSRYVPHDLFLLLFHVFVSVSCGVTCRSLEPLVRWRLLEEDCRDPNSLPDLSLTVSPRLSLLHCSESTLNDLVTVKPSSKLGRLHNT